MEINNNYHESIADFGCRKVLGMRSAVGYINGIRHPKKDCFINTRKKIKNMSNDNIKKGITIAGVLAGAALLVGLIKGKKPVTATGEAAKTGILSKIKGLFKKPPSTPDVPPTA